MVSALGKRQDLSTDMVQLLCLSSHSGEIHNMDTCEDALMLNVVTDSSKISTRKRHITEHGQHMNLSSAANWLCTGKHLLQDATHKG